MLKQRWFQVSGISARDQWLSLLYDTDIVGEQVIKLPGDNGQVRLVPQRIPKEYPVVPPWRIDYRLGDETFQKEEQGHGYHGWWESGKMGGGSDPSASAGAQPDPGQATSDFLAANPTGFTISTKDGSTPITGFNVGGVVAPLDIENKGDYTAIASAVDGYVKQNADLLSRPDMFLGGWQNPNGSYTIEVSQQIANQKDAAKAAIDRNQYSFWDNAQAKENTDARTTGVNKDGSLYTPPAEGQKDTLPDPEQQSYGTGDFGKLNPNSKEGVAAGAPTDPTHTITDSSSRAEGRIAPNVAGRLDAGSTGMSQSYQDKADSVLQAAGMPSRATMAQNATSLLDRASAQQWANGLTDWGRLNGESIKVSGETHGVVSEYAAAGVIAAMSPKCSLGANVAGAHLVAQAVATNMVMHFDPQVLADYNAGLRTGKDRSPSNILNDTPLLGQPTRDDAAAAIMLYANQNGLKEDPQYAELTASGEVPGLTFTTKDGVGKAIEIAAGFKFDDPFTAATPDNTLGSSGLMKERDMFNNIINPSDTLSTTVDGWIAGALQGSGQYSGKIADTEKKNAELYNAVMTAPQSAKDNYGRAGCYAVLVDAVVAAADAHDVIPQEAQAVGWEVTRDEAKGKENTAGNNAELHSVDTTAPQGRDVTTLDDATAIIQDGPKDSVLGHIPNFFESNPGPDKGAEAEDYSYTDAIAQSAKADVSSRIADHCTSSTSDLVNAANPVEVGFADDNMLLASLLGSSDKSVREEAVSTIVSMWAGTSNDSNPQSLAIQDAAEKEFGLQDTKGWDTHDTISAGEKNLVAEHGAVYQDVLRAQYNDTQQMFKDQGISSITLYRGQSVEPTDLNPTVSTSSEPYRPSETSKMDTVQMRPMSSWSASYSTAADFTTNGPASNDPYAGLNPGYVMTAQVPVSQIMSCPRTGFGCLNEHEFVVLGNVKSVSVTGEF
jgi:hypothetical protein